MAGFTFDPRGKFVKDAWGWDGRGDFVQGPGGRWYTSGSSELQPGADIGAPSDPSELFDTREAAVAALGPRPGRTQSQNAYSASLAQQGIPESELPYNSGQMRTFLAQAGRGLPVADYLQKWARSSPGAWSQLGNRMYAERPQALSKILADKQDPETWTPERQRAALIEWLMRQYGGTQAPTGAA